MAFVSSDFLGGAQPSDIHDIAGHLWDVSFSIYIFYHLLSCPSTGRLFPSALEKLE